MSRHAPVRSCAASGGSARVAALVSAVAAATLGPILILEGTASARGDLVGVIAIPGSRLALELKHELEAARLVAIALGATGDDWIVAATDLKNVPFLQGVVVGANDRWMVVFARDGDSGGIQVHLELRFDPKDRPARRRACLAVVESLRVLADRTPGRAAMFVVPGAAAGASASIAAAAASTAAAPRAAAAPGAAVAPAEAVAAVAADTIAARSERQPGLLGVGTMLDLDATLGQPMGHLQFIWHLPLGARFAFRAQVLWPVMGSQLQAAGSDVRMWTFGASAGVQYSLREPNVRLRPFVGLAIGSQLLLTDAGRGDADRSRAPLRPGETAGLQAGARFALVSRVQLFSEIEATRNWLQMSNASRDAGSATNSFSFHVSSGVMFEY
jgi:hypothetical protein